MQRWKMQGSMKWAADDGDWCKYSDAEAAIAAAVAAERERCARVCEQHGVQYGVTGRSRELSRAAYEIRKGTT